MTPYTEFRWFYPPRTDMRAAYIGDGPLIGMWKRMSDSVAQFKLNGVNDQLIVYPDRHIEHWSRHKLDEQRKDSSTGKPDQIKNFTLPTSMRDEILDLTPAGTFTIYNVELMDSRTKRIKNTLYFFDVLVYEGQHLLGMTYAERYGILQKMFGARYFSLDMENIDGKIFVAENLPPSKWDETWAALKAKGPAYTEVEGLVLKRTGITSALSAGLREKNNSGFMCRVRKPTKNCQN